MQPRIDHVKKLLSEQGLDAVLISSIPNIIYLSNYHGFIPDERDGYILITKNEAFIITTMLYSETMPQVVPHLKLLEINQQHSLTTLLLDQIKKLGITSLGYEQDNLTVGEFKHLKNLPVKCIPMQLDHLRRSKSSDEIESIKKACELTDKGFTYLLESLKVGMSEKECETLLLKFFINNDVESSFRAVVAFGANASVPHHLSGGTTLKKNDLVLVDFGAKVDSYCADMTRTFFVGSASKKHMQVYNLVRDAQQAAIAFIATKLKQHEPIKTDQVDQIARKVISAQKYPSYPHSLGHAIGLEVHEPPRLSPNVHDELTENMVFTIEPGIYLPGEIGVRIEDMFLIKNAHLIQITQSPKTLLEIAG